MKIKARLSISADGYITTPSGWPALTADPAFAPGSSHGIRPFLEGCDQALMGSATFALAAPFDRWPWPDLDVFVLGSTPPEGTPDHVVFEHDPATLLDRLRAANRGGDVHLVGGPKTIETFRALGALDELQLVVLPLLLGDGGRLTPSLSPDAGLTFLRSTSLPEGSVEIVYDISAGATSTVPGRDAEWKPASQRPSDAR
jgi:dihydrofolate reductase